MSALGGKIIPRDSTLQARLVTQQLGLPDHWCLLQLIVLSAMLVRIWLLEKVLAAQLLKPVVALKLISPYTRWHKPLLRASNLCIEWHKRDTARKLLRIYLLRMRLTTQLSELSTAIVMELWLKA